MFCVGCRRGTCGGYFYHMSPMLGGSAFLFPQSSFSKHRNRERKDDSGCNVCSCMLRTHRKSLAEVNVLQHLKKKIEILKEKGLYKGLVLGKLMPVLLHFFSYVRNNCTSQLLILTTLRFMMSRADGTAWEMFHGGLTSECQ